MCRHEQWLCARGETCRTGLCLRCTSMRKFGLWSLTVRKRVCMPWRRSWFGSATSVYKTPQNLLASLAALLVLREPAENRKRYEHDDQLRAMYLSVKSQVNSKLQKLKSGEERLHGVEYITELPAGLQACPEGFKAKIKETVTPKFEILDLVRLAEKVPCRSTRRGLTKEKSGIGVESSVDFAKLWMMATAMQGMQQSFLGGRHEALLAIQMLQPQSQLGALLDRALTGQPSQPYAAGRRGSPS